MTKNNSVIVKNSNIKTVPSDGIVGDWITKAIQQNLPVETMERLFELRAKMKAEAAKEAFDEAMASFQGECPIIEKKKEVHNKNGALLYSYAPLDSIVRQVQEVLKRNGFSYSIKVEKLPEGLKATCIAKHKFGHSEESSMEVPLGTKTEIMSNTQVFAAASTFAKRYAFCNVFGIMSGEPDKEEVLLDQEFKTNAMLEYMEKLQKCKTTDELKQVWVTLPALARKEYQGLKDEIKTAIEEQPK